MYLFVSQLFVIILLAVLYFYLGLYEGYVYTRFWFDILLHILGGMWTALASMWFFSLFSVRLTLWQVLMFAFAVGLSWEAFEYVFDIGGSNFMSYQLDTVKDLIDDIIGGLIAYTAIMRTLRNR